MRPSITPLLFSLTLAALSGCGSGGSDSGGTVKPPPPPPPANLDEQLTAKLAEQGFTGTAEQQLESRLGRKVDPKLADLGRLLFFDRIVSLHNDNACAGCHSPSHGYGDTQSIAIGVQNNLVVGPNRTGPRNERRSPSIVNAEFYPALMWNGRFFAPSGDPFNNSLGFTFPQPEGTSKFRPNDPAIPTLLVAQAFLPPTELKEMAGFTGIRDGLDPRFLQFDDGQGEYCPALDATGFRNEPIRARVEERLNAVPEYVAKFSEVFSEVRDGARVDFSMVARALAEYEIGLPGANAPIDRFARGEKTAMSEQEKRGALLFFGKANCVACHAVKGTSNEMFSDFKAHNIGVPQIAPVFGAGSGNVIFNGPGEDEDYGLAQMTGLAGDRYKFRTSPLRNVSLQAAFFHNGAFTRLEDAVRHHLDVLASLQGYNAKRAGVAKDLALRMAPIAYVSAGIDPLLRKPLALSAQEQDDLVQFLRTGLLDARMLPASACTHVPPTLPSGLAPLKFESCPPGTGG
jgi:cytochrome c peroxidase